MQLIVFSPFADNKNSKGGEQVKQLLMEAMRHDYKHKSQKFCLWKQSRQRSQGRFLCSDKGDDLLGGFQTVGVQKTNPVILSCSETHSAHSSIQFGVKTKIDGAHSIIQGVPKNALSHLPSISRRLSIPDIRSTGGWECWQF